MLMWQALIRGWQISETILPKFGETVTIAVLGQHESYEQESVASVIEIPFFIASARKLGDARNTSFLIDGAITEARMACEKELLERIEKGMVTPKQLTADQRTKVIPAPMKQIGEG